MEQHQDSELEDGEITDDDYTPLERPSNYSSIIQPKPNVQQVVESEEEEEVNSSSDSNSDCDIKPKRPKVKAKPKLLPKNSTRKTNNIWCNAAQEDVLLENLVNCDVSNVDRSRNVETYITRVVSKRTYSDRHNRFMRPMKRTDFNIETKLENYIPRLILDLQYTANDSEEDVAKDIANKLYEQKEELIKLVVQVAGKEKAISLFEETKQIEANGGMMIFNFQRRRTPGGIFLHLVKQAEDLTREQLLQIFNEDKLKLRQEMRTQRKLKIQIAKQKIKAEHAKHLPELLNRRKSKFQPKTIGETAEVDVKNPPPSPATDVVENGTDELENLNAINSDHRNVVDYEDDCIDIGVADMDLF